MMDNTFKRRESQSWINFQGNQAITFVAVDTENTKTLCPKQESSSMCMGVNIVLVFTSLYAAI